MKKKEKVYLISYDLGSKSGENYKKITDQIEELGSDCWHNLSSTSIVKTVLSAGDIKTKLAECIDGKDKLLILQIDGERTWQGFKAEDDKWLINVFGKDGAY